MVVGEEQINWKTMVSSVVIKRQVVQQRLADLEVTSVLIAVMVGHCWDSNSHFASLWASELQQDFTLPLQVLVYCELSLYS